METLRAWTDAFEGVCGRLPLVYLIKMRDTPGAPAFASFALAQLCTQTGARFLIMNPSDPRRVGIALERMADRESRAFSGTAAAPPEVLRSPARTSCAGRKRRLVDPVRRGGRGRRPILMAS